MLRKKKDAGVDIPLVEQDSPDKEPGNKHLSTPVFRIKYLLPPVFRIKESISSESKRVSFIVISCICVLSHIQGNHILFLEAHRETYNIKTQ